MSGVLSCKKARKDRGEPSGDKADGFLRGNRNGFVPEEEPDGFGCGVVDYFAVEGKAQIPERST